MSSLVAEFHKFSASIYQDQQQFTRKTILDEMSVQIKDYDTAKIKESLKNWFSYQSEINYIPKSQKLLDKEIQAEIHRIVNKCAEKQLHHNVVYLECNQFPQCINQHNSIQSVDMQINTENNHQEQSSRDTNCSNQSGTITQHQETLSTYQNIQSEKSQQSFNIEQPSFLNKYK
ncbi:Hypothetical_protein [Hexamita inflata]|uniref:Hypothetical_protein n=1 Tax=Hexamita inflata TaxID=28002 RepID=A0AA86UCB8_9EUKA|nr:Hypothetical protein HINF_LOCUS33107 [Hexamita inflata]